MKTATRKPRTVGHGYDIFVKLYLRRSSMQASFEGIKSEFARLRRLMQHSGCWDVPFKAFHIYMWADMEEIMAQGGWVSYIDGRKAKPYSLVSMKRLRLRFFSFIKHCALREWLPVETYERLRLLPTPKAGMNGVKIMPPVRAVPVEVCNQYEPYVPICLWDFMRLSYLCGGRPGEIACMSLERMRKVEDRVWVYKPPQHKKLWRLEERDIYLGPQCMKIISLYATLPPSAYLFNFKTMSMQFRQLTSNRQQHPRTWRKSSDESDKPVLRWQLHRFFKRAAKFAAENGTDLPRIAPNQLRHSAATRVRSTYGLEGAAVVIQDTTTQAQVYAEKHTPLAIQIARESM